MAHFLQFDFFQKKNPLNNSQAFFFFWVPTVRKIHPHPIEKFIKNLLKIIIKIKNEKLKKKTPS